MKTEAENAFPQLRMIVRVTTLLDFFLALLIVVPVAHRSVDRGLHALRGLGLEDLVGWAIPIWILGSTILATLLYVWILWRQPKVLSSARLSLEGKLIIAWWITLSTLVIYGYSLGTGS